MELECSSELHLLVKESEDWVDWVKERAIEERKVRRA